MLGLDLVERRGAGVAPLADEAGESAVREAQLLGPDHQHPPVAPAQRAGRRTPQHVRPTDEGGHEEGRGALVQVVGRPHLVEPAPAEHGHAIAQVERLLLLVGHEQGRDPHPLDQRVELTPRALAETRVEVGKRLVEQQHPRLGGEGARQGDPLLLPARQFVRLAPLEPGEVDQFQRRRDLAVAALPVEPVQPEAHVIADVQVREQRVVLEHHPAAPPRGRQRRHVLALDREASRVRELEPGEQAQHGRLAAPRRPEQRHDLTARDLERHGADRHRVRPLLPHAVERHKGRHGPFPFAPSPFPRTCSSQ